MTAGTDDKAASSDRVLYERRGRVALLLLHNPEKLNALSIFDMRETVRALVKRAELDPEVFAIVISGSGKAFCSGADIEVATQHSGMSEFETAAMISSSRSLADSESPALFSYLRTTNKPVIAAVNGIAAGGGMVLSLMCDLRFASDSASFLTIFARRGFIAEHGIGWLLARQVGISGALDLLISSRKVDAAEALRMRLVDRVFPADDLLESTIAYVEAMAETVSPHAIATMKQQVYAGLDATFKDATREADRLMMTALASPDAAEGGRSFMERRKPRFRRLPDTEKIERVS